MSSEIIRNFNYFDSDEEYAEYEENDFEDLEDKNYKNSDEDTEENLEILSDLLKEIGTVHVLGLKTYKIIFFNTKVKNLENKKCQCDFDTREDGFPIIPEGGETFIIPYIYQISDIVEFFNGCQFETNIGENFKI